MLLFHVYFPNIFRQPDNITCKSSNGQLLLALFAIFLEEQALQIAMSSKTGDHVTFKNIFLRPQNNF
jgi:hypothetical protein